MKLDDIINRLNSIVKGKNIPSDIKEKSIVLNKE